MENKYFISERYYDAQEFPKLGWSEWTKYSTACVKHSNYNPPLWQRVFESKSAGMKVIKILKKINKTCEYKLEKVPEDKTEW